MQGYAGYGDGVGTDLTTFIGDGMRSGWAANRDERLPRIKCTADIAIL